MADSSESFETIRKLYLTAATVESRKNTYFIGPYGKRVSFASQQQRAFNTVWALHSEKKIKAGSRVAVIGAGLSGITAVGALLAKQCLVWLYDARPDVLEVQARASHRYVHPTINFWPETKIRPTTSFPFFDWYESICSSNVGRLKKEWNDYFRERASGKYFETIVSAIAYRPENSTVVVTAAGKGPTTMEFDIALVCTGFGAEDRVTGANGLPYWEVDYLDQRAENAGNLVVSGIGDGGLIDALRALHKRFESGALTVKLAGMLTTAGISALLQELEKDVINRSEGKSDEAAALYAQKYSEVVSYGPPLCSKILDDSYRNNSVELIGKLAYPFSLTAAPIHKYMIAHALKNNKLIYRQGSVEDGPQLKTATATTPIVADTCIIRHGGKAPPLTKLISVAEAEELKQTQSRIADLLWVPYGHDFWAGGIEGYPKQDFTSTDFAYFRRPLAAMFCLENFRLPMGLRLQNGLPKYVMFKEVGAPIPQSMPESLFGIPLVSHDNEMADAYAI